MQSKTSCFNGAVFRKTLSRCWVLWAGAALILFFSMPYLIGRTNPPATFSGVSATEIVSGIVITATVNLPIFTFLFGLVFAAATFDYLFSRRSTGLMASLPLRREGLFLSSFAAGLTMLLSAGLLAAVLAVILTLTKGVHDFSSVWTWLGVYAAESVTFYGIGVFCGMLTGHILVLPCLYGLVNLGGVMLSGMLQYMAKLLLIGVPSDGTLGAFSWLEKLSPLSQLLTETGMDYDSAATHFRGGSVVLIYLAVGVALTALALLLFKRRKMECAQEPVTSKGLGQALKYIVTFFCALGLPAFISLFFRDNISESAFGVLALTALGAAIGYLISEMILHKSVRVRKKSWIGVAVTALVACLIVGAMQLDVFGYVHNVPDPAEIKSAEIEAWYQFRTEVTDPDALADLTALHRDLIDEQEPGFYSRSDLRLTYHLKNGKTLTRAYAVFDDNSAECTAGRLRGLLRRSDVVVDFYLDPYHELTTATFQYAYINWTEPASDDFISLDFDKQTALDLWRSGILPDLEAGAFPSVGLDDPEAAFSSWPTVEYQVYWDDVGSQHLSYVVTPDCTHTLAWLAEHGFEIPGVE